MMIKYNPCNGCTAETGRHIGCHSTCYKYIKAKAKHAKRLEAKKDEYNKHSDYIRYVTCVIAKEKKRRK